MKDPKPWPLVGVEIIFTGCNKHLTRWIDPQFSRDVRQGSYLRLVNGNKKQLVVPLSNEVIQIDEEELMDGAPMLLRNHSVPGRHWVSLELAGTKSNRLAIGARIKLSAGGITQTDQVRSGGSYLSQSNFRVHFGLGTATKIDSVEIRWPSGATDFIKNIEADKFYAVLEGKGIVPFEQIRPTAPAH